jgi:hypothetical protein
LQRSTDFMPTCSARRKSSLTLCVTVISFKNLPNVCTYVTRSNYIVVLTILRGVACMQGYIRDAGFSAGAHCVLCSPWHLVKLWRTKNSMQFIHALKHAVPPQTKTNGALFRHTMIWKFWNFVWG